MKWLTTVTAGLLGSAKATFSIWVFGIDDEPDAAGAMPRTTVTCRPPPRPKLRISTRRCGVGGACGPATPRTTFTGACRGSAKDTVSTCGCEPGTAGAAARAFSGSFAAGAGSAANARQSAAAVTIAGPLCRREDALIPPPRSPIFGATLTPKRQG